MWLSECYRRHNERNYDGVWECDVKCEWHDRLLSGNEGADMGVGSIALTINAT